MKIGDIVMYIDKGRYAKWFWGCLATVISYTPTHPHDTRSGSCRVQWMVPVEYHGRKSTISDFGENHFEVISEGR
jgi:hypothetical protein